MSRVRQGLRKAENQTDMGGQSERGQAWEPQVLRTQVAVSAGEGRPGTLGWICTEIMWLWKVSLACVCHSLCFNQIFNFKCSL